MATPDAPPPSNEERLARLQALHGNLRNATDQMERAQSPLVGKAALHVRVGQSTQQLREAVYAEDAVITPAVIGAATFERGNTRSAM